MSLRRIGIIFAGVLFLFFASLRAFQVASPASGHDASGVLELVEAGRATKENVPAAFLNLEDGRYAEARASVTPEVAARFPWLTDYLDGLIRVSAPLQKIDSVHFEFYFPPDQLFLADYAIPALEQAYGKITVFFDHVPPQKIRVEIYSNKDDFSAASTLSPEILERSGAIGICKFHRLMILSPKSLPMGYRWLDALAHEFTHLMVNELSSAHAELWLHEGTAHYFDTAWRLDPPVFLTPLQKTDLKSALDEKRLIAFKRMSPSLVYLKNQDEVSLAFSQVSHAISLLIHDFGMKKYVQFLKGLSQKPFAEMFQAIYRMSPEQFEEKWQAALASEKWSSVKGAMSDQVQFEGVNDESFIGADAQGKMRLGDRMRLLGRNDAALIEYEKALEIEPDNGVILLKAAKMDLMLGHRDQAMERLRHAVATNPNYETPYVYLASMVSPAEAEQLLQSAAAINPFDPAIKEILGRVRP